MAIKLRMNGRNVMAREGQTLLEVAEDHGISIPTLCRNEGVRPYGACRLCLVQVTKGKKKRVVVSCTYPAQEGIAVYTDTKEIAKARRMIMELELASNPDSEELRKIAVGLGVDVDNPRITPDKTSPEDPGYNCILCGLCVRVCKEVVGVNAIGFANRGPKRVVVPPFGEKAKLCIGCGSCAYVCPTNCIRMEDVGNRRTIFNWNARFRLVNCTGCGNPFATDKEIDHAIAQAGMPEELARVCHNCR